MLKKVLLLGLAAAAVVSATEDQAQNDSDVMNAEWTGVAVLCKFNHDHDGRSVEAAGVQDRDRDRENVKFGTCKFKYGNKILFFDVRDSFHEKENFPKEDAEAVPRNEL